MKNTEMRKNCLLQALMSLCSPWIMVMLLSFLSSQAHLFARQTISQHKNPIPAPPKNVLDTPSAKKSASFVAIQPQPVAMIPQSAPTPKAPLPPITHVPPQSAANIPVTLPPTPVTVTSTNPFQIKYNDVAAKQAMLEKIIGTRDLLAQITATSAQQDKDSVASLVNSLFAQHGGMKKNELREFANLLSLCSANQFFLASNQRPAMRQWTELIEKAVTIAEDERTLLVSLKDQINKDKINFKGSINAASYAINLLATQLPAEEVNKNNKNGLLALLRDKVLSYYNNRSNKPVIDTQSLNDLLKLAQAQPGLKDVVKREWGETLALDLLLATATAQQNFLARIATWKTITPMIKASTDRYEKGLFINALSTFFIHRKERAMSELDEFKKLLLLLRSENFKQNKVFERSDFARFYAWENVLSGTLLLHAAQEDKPLTQKTEKLIESLSFVAQSGAFYEKNMLVRIISDFFNQRGNMMRTDLDIIKQLFEKIKSTPKLLNTNQLTTLNLWINEIAQACFITTGSKTYLDAALTDATATKNVARFIKIIDLYTTQTPPAIKGSFVNGLNALFIARKTLDQKALINLLNKVNAKKIDHESFLNTTQQAVLTQWLQIMTTEEKPAGAQR